MAALTKSLSLAVEKVKSSKRTIAFTGAGISVESGIPAFRGDNGIWSQYDPRCIEIGYFQANPIPAWKIIKEIFYDHFSEAVPNPAHISLAILEQHNLLHGVITQNIDHLHQMAGSKRVIEYHGSNHMLICLQCKNSIEFDKNIFSSIPPRCKLCQGLLKPDFVFFGESIPIHAHNEALKEAKKAKVWLIIGTSGEIYPACELPLYAKNDGAFIIEINTIPSRFTTEITDIFLQGKASEVLSSLAEKM